jgi:hypothetical protein
VYSPWDGVSSWMLCHYSNLLSLIFNHHFLSLDWRSSQLYLLVNSYYFPSKPILINSSLFFETCYQKVLSFKINRTSTSRATALHSQSHISQFLTQFLSDTQSLLFQTRTQPRSHFTRNLSVLRNFQLFYSLSSKLHIFFSPQRLHNPLTFSSQWPHQNRS